jgi:UDPglucose 6-dehydrogenase
MVPPGKEGFAMQIAVYGAGYLGTIVSACLADFGTPVTCYDDDAARVERLARGLLSYHEKDLKEMIRRNVRAGRLVYSTTFETFAEKADVVVLAEDSGIYAPDSAEKVARVAPKEAILVVVTPVAVGTAAKIEQKLRAAKDSRPVVSHPLFLTNGCAVEDFNWPDRIVLGSTSHQAVLTLKHLYRPLALRGVPVIVTNHETAELVRQASTAFVATKISFINELSSLCERVGADSGDLALAMGLDKKISPRCLQPGATLGGAFVEADMESLAHLARSAGTPLKILGAAREVSGSHSDRLVEKISQTLDSVSGKEIAILGLAFKPNTNSVAASSSILLAKRLLSRGAHVRAYDPVAIPDARNELDNAVRCCDSAYAAAEGSDAIVVGTGWPEFRSLDFDKLKRLLRRPVIVDTKNLLDGGRLRAMGFQYVGMGRS